MTREPKPPMEVADDIREKAGEPENRFDQWDEMRWMQVYYLYCISWDLHQIATSNTDRYTERPSSEDGDI